MQKQISQKMKSNTVANLIKTLGEGLGQMARKD
jgi:hypothetical protein